MTEIEILSMRLEKVEKSYRRVRMGILIGILMACAGALLAQSDIEILPSGRPILIRPTAVAPVSDTPTEDHVRARTFTLVDAAGRDKASLVTDGGGSVFLVMFDNAGKTRAELSVKPNGPSMVFYDPSTKARLVLGSTGLVPSHVSYKGVVEKDPPSSIVLFDRDGQIISRTP
jgi:hypothetical protein